MRRLQWTLFLLVKSACSQNSSAFHFSHLEDVSSGTAMEEENATGETSQSSQVRSDQNTIVMLHPGFASLHSRPSPAFSVQWTRSCRIWRGLPCIERSYPAKVSDGVKNVYKELILQVPKSQTLLSNEEKQLFSPFVTSIYMQMGWGITIIS